MVINTPTGWNDKFNSIMEQRNKLSDEEQSKLLAILQQNKKINIWKEKPKWDTATQEDLKEDKWLESLRWDRDGILNYLKENPKYIKIEKNAEVMWHKWKKVHINLPKVWNFEWFKFDYFVSDDRVSKRDFEAKPELKKKSYSMNDVSNLLTAMNGFMAALGCETDWDTKYKNDELMNRYRCGAWDCLKAITWLNKSYWLSNSNVAWIKDSRVKWRCRGGSCNFNRYYDANHYANLFLRLSD